MALLALSAFAGAFSGSSARLPPATVSAQAFVMAPRQHSNAPAGARCAISYSALSPAPVIAPVATAAAHAGGSISIYSALNQSMHDAFFFVGL